MRRCAQTILASLLTLSLLAQTAPAEPVQLSESPTDLRVFQVRTLASTTGKLVTLDEPGKTKDLPIEATASFAFLERRLPAAGRDALAYRALRDFSTAQMKAHIQGEETGLALPETSSLVVTSGRLQGLESYSLRTLLTRDHIDLLNIPGDTLGLIASLPDTSVDVDSEWLVPQWAAQLLAGIEAVESARVTGRVLSIDGQTARLQLSGTVQGMQEGAKTTVQIQGEVNFSLTGQFLQAARLKYTIESGIGAVSPGVNAEVNVTVTRTPSAEAGRITDAVVEAIPLEVPERALQLVFDAPPWNARVRHGRGWYVFHAVLDQPPKVAILRLVEQGSLICQCNLSPIPDAAPGQHTPVEQYEQDISTVLGKSLKGITSRQVTPLADGRTLVEVVAQGEVEVNGKDKEGQAAVLQIPMEWRYYIVADRSGRQMSFVFAVEQSLTQQLAGRDRALVESLEFLAPR